MIMYATDIRGKSIK